MTTRDDIEKGPRFEPSQERQTCVACGLKPGAWNIDRETGLDLPCWRAWRFGAQAVRLYDSELLKTPPGPFVPARVEVDECPSCGWRDRRGPRWPCDDPWHMVKP